METLACCPEKKSGLQNGNYNPVIPFNSARPDDFSRPHLGVVILGKTAGTFYEKETIWQTHIAAFLPVRFFFFFL